MNDKKHFHYEGNVHLNNKPKQVEVVDVCFLTPARVTAKVNGCDVEVTVGVDIVNRKVYENNTESPLAEQIFEYLDNVNSLPEDFFQASDELQDQAAEAQVDHDSVKERMSNV